MTAYKFKLTNGEEVTATLNFGALYRMRTNHKALYKRYNELTSKQTLSEMDIVELIYVAYVSANADKEVYDLEEFLELLPMNREEIIEIYQGLTPRVNSKN